MGKGNQRRCRMRNKETTEKKLELARLRIEKLENWIREEGERNHTCTYEILDREICSDCQCSRRLTLKGKGKQ